MVVMSRVVEIETNATKKKDEGHIEERRRKSVVGLE